MVALDRATILDEAILFAAASQAHGNRKVVLECVLRNHLIDEWMALEHRGWSQAERNAIGLELR